MKLNRDLEAIAAANQHAIDHGRQVGRGQWTAEDVEIFLRYQRDNGAGGK